MEMAITTSAKMGAAEKQKLSQEMLEVQGSAGNMVRMKNLLNDMIVK